MKTKETTELTPLEQQLRELAIKNWNEFVQLVGPEAVLSAKICMLRKDGKSYGKISVSLKISRDKARKRNKPCAC